MKITLCGIIGHRPLRGRCPINHITQASNEIYRALGTADHMTLERPVVIVVVVVVVFVVVVVVVVL